MTGSCDGVFLLASVLCSLAILPVQSKIASPITPKFIPGRMPVQQAWRVIPLAEPVKITRATELNMPSSYG